MLLKVASKQLEALNLPWSQPPALWPGTLFVEDERSSGEGWRLSGTEHHYVVMEVPAGRGSQTWDLHTCLAGYGLPVARPVALAAERRGCADLITLELPSRAKLLSEALLMGHDWEALSQRVANLLIHLHLAGLVGQGHERWQFALDEAGDAVLLYAEGTVGDPTAESRGADRVGLEAGLSASARAAFATAEKAADFASAVDIAYDRLWGDIADIRLFEEPEIKLTTRVTQLGPTAERSPVGVRLRCSVVDHPYKLLLGMLTGLDVGAPRGKQLLRDIFRYHAWLEFSSGRKWPRALAANRWLGDCFLPAVSKLPDGLGKSLIGRGC